MAKKKKTKEKKSKKKGGKYFSFKKCTEKMLEYKPVWAALIVLSIIGLLIDYQGAMTALRIVFGVFFVLFLPGFFATIAFFPKKGELDDIEIIALSFGLSIAVVPFTVFLLNIVLNIPVNIISVTGEILVLIGLFWGVYYKKTGKYW